MVWIRLAEMPTCETTTTAGSTPMSPQHFVCDPSATDLLRVPEYGQCGPGPLARVLTWCKRDYDVTTM
jgi:hypothetical protein